MDSTTTDEEKDTTAKSLDNDDERKVVTVTAEKTVNHESNDKLLSAEKNNKRSLDATNEICAEIQKEKIVDDGNLLNENEIEIFVIKKNNYSPKKGVETKIIKEENTKCFEKEKIVDIEKPSVLDDTKNERITCHMKNESIVHDACVKKEKVDNEEVTKIEREKNITGESNAEKMKKATGDINHEKIAHNIKKERVDDDEIPKIANNAKQESIVSEKRIDDINHEKIVHGIKNEKCDDHQVPKTVNEAIVESIACEKIGHNIKKEKVEDNEVSQTLNNARIETITAAETKEKISCGIKNEQDNGNIVVDENPKTNLGNENITKNSEKICSNKNVESTTDIVMPESTANGLEINNMSNEATKVKLVTNVNTEKSVNIPDMQCPQKDVVYGLYSVMEKKMQKTFDSRLLSRIRKHPIIYDSKHPFYYDTAKVNEAWEDISHKYGNVESCKARYTELRHKYDSYMRRLRNQYRQENSEQVFMNLDSELICLFKFLVDPQQPDAPHKIVEAAKDTKAEEQHEPPKVEDDDLILIETKPELIVIDEDEIEAHTIMVEYRITKEMKVLVEQIRKNPELYDNTHKGYNDYSRKSYIWNTIATKMGDKATKLMKRWILMVTRYEWELSRKRLGKINLETYETDLQKLLKNFQRYILQNPDTVYKQSFYLKYWWQVPIDHFSDTHALIEQMKKTPKIVSVTDALLLKPEKSKEFLELWQTVAKIKDYTPGQCELTWLIMRSFYGELMKMRQHKYQLVDKWYFENIVTELYELSMKLDKKQIPRGEQLELSEDEPMKTKANQRKRGNSNSKSQNAKKRKTQCSKKATENTTIPKNLSATSTTSTPQSVAEQAPLPKITSAISLAPKMPPSLVGNSSLVIRPIGSVSSNVTSAPLQPLVVNIPPDQLPFALPKQTKISAIIMPPPALPLVISSARTIVSPEGGLIKIPPNITITPTTVLPKPMISINSVSTVSLPPLAPLLKISSAISLVNPNDILIEMKGHSLFVENPTLQERYQLPMSAVEKFIREVLAIPLLHYEHHIQPNHKLITEYWEHVAKKFRLPSHICRSCWNFLKDKFYRIVSLKDLMKPFATTTCVWTESFDLFQRFDQHAVSHGWIEYVSALPELIICIGSYRVLYQDVSKDAKVLDKPTETQILHIWCSIGSRFPNISHISTIWTSIKNVFCRYMSDIELGIDNKWHILWWRVFSKLKFLIETRYSPNEPYFYIVNNKMMKEIKRCSQFTV